ncbi:MAG: GC-type dockerin domain-anchored protein [Phycisphaerales bacterium]|jgi:hypothetical protein|nr:GC-type dockerin domain-anchored protein [Phycisphaerales bacterium]
MNRTDSTHSPTLLSTLATAALACSVVACSPLALAQSSRGESDLRPKLVQLPNGRMALRTERVERKPAATSSMALPGGGGGGSAASTNLADWNGDGEVNSSDHLAFINDFKSHAPRADLDKDGGWNSSDMLAFQNAYALASAGGPSDAMPEITPGDGFGGVTPDGAARAPSSEFAADATPISRWNLVPFQRINDSMIVGLLAYHANGIASVQISADGSDFEVVPLARDDSQDVEQYAARLVASSGTDRLVELRAIVTPSLGQTRVLQGAINAESNNIGIHSMYVWVGPEKPSVYISPNGNDASGDGSRQRPLKTFERAGYVLAQRNNGKLDGTTVYLLPGEYTLCDSRGSADREWFTIARDPASDPGSAVIVGRSNDPMMRMQRFKDLVVRPRDGNIVFPAPIGSQRMLWIDGCALDGIDRMTSKDWLLDSRRYDGTYITNTSVRETPNGLSDTHFLSNVHVDGIASDAFQHARMMVNCTLRDVDHRNTGAHADVVQYAPSVNIQNAIFYGLTAVEGISAQGLFLNGPTRDLAIVNCSLNNQPFPSGRRVFFVYSVDHMVIQNLDLVGPTSWSGGAMRNTVVKGLHVDPRYNGGEADVIRPRDYPGVVYR